MGGISTNEIIAGMGALFAGAGVALHKLGMLNLSKKVPNNGAGKEIKTLSDLQIVQGQILAEHEKRHDKHDDNINEITKTFGSINTKIGILLDRSDRGQ